MARDKKKVEEAGEKWVGQERRGGAEGGDTKAATTRNSDVLVLASVRSRFLFVFLRETKNIPPRMFLVFPVFCS